MAKQFNIRSTAGTYKTPSPNPTLEEKVMFYFGDTHKKYKIGSSKDKNERVKLIDRIDICSSLTIRELETLSKSNGGTEKIPVDQIKVPLPDVVTPDVKHVMSMRFGGKKHRLIGIIRGNVFNVLIVDYKLKAYNH